MSEREAIKYKETNSSKDILNLEEIKFPTTNIAEIKYNKLSIFGLILSVIAVFGVGLAGIVGFILGIVSLTQIKYTHQKGKGLAIAAIVVGFTWSFVIGIVQRLIEAGF